MKLTKSADLAAEWEMTESEFHRARRRNGWPCVEIKRGDVRFTDLQIEQIVAMQTRGGKKPKAAANGTGQSARSAARGGKR